MTNEIVYVVSMVRMTLDAANAIELIKQIYTFAFDAYSDWLNLGLG